MGGAESLMVDCGGDGGGGSGSTTCVGWDGDPIDMFWGAPITKVAGRGGGDAVTTATAATGGAGTALEGGYGIKKPLEFPRAFSRHSTLEEERRYVNDNNRKCDEKECGVQRRHWPWSPPSVGVIGALASPREGRRRLQQTAGAEQAEDGRQRNAVSGLRLLALCRVMIGSMHVAAAPSPTVTAQHTSTCGGDGMSSHECVSPSRAPVPLPAPFSLPPPPPGQAEFDSVYFPREEEYRLLNEAFVLPEFLVIHRFVAASTLSTPASRSGSGRSSPPWSAGSSAAAARTGAGAASSVVTDGERQQSPAEKRSARSRGRETGQLQQQFDRHCPYDALEGKAPPSAWAMPQDAASVVAGIEATMGSPVVPPRTNLLSSQNVGASSMPWGGEEALCSLASSSRCAGVNSAFSSSRGGRDGGRCGALSFELNGGSGDVEGTSDYGKSSDGDRGQGRGLGRERDSGRATRDSIARGVKLECEHPLHFVLIWRFRVACGEERVRTPVKCFC